FTKTPRSRDQPLHGLAQFRAESAQRLLASGGLDVRPHRTREQLQRLSPAAQRFAPEQVERLDAVRPFVDRVQPVVAVELLDRILTRVSVSAVDLDGEAARLQAV